MTLLREGNSINFQKASCTLDGCVKIYTSRVDSVDTDTKRLLSGLADSDSADRDRTGEHDAEEDDESEGQEKRPKRKSARASNTLEKDASALNLKKFDLEFMVDPLFKKTSADFDEGGARGLLLNHLSIAKDGKIIFDASDATASGMEEEDGDESHDKDIRNQEPIDVTRLRAMFLPKLNMIWEQDVCPSLKSFEFGNTSTTFEFGRLGESSTLDSQESGFGTYDDAAYDDFSVGEDDDNDIDGTGYDAGGADGLGALFSLAETGMGNHLQENEIMMGPSTEGDNVFSYFDTAMLKSWAGPEHWRATAMKKPAKPPGTPMKRAPKPRDLINFLDPEEVDYKALFAPAKSSIQMPKTTERTRSAHLLPGDQHFSSKDLLRLFLKPDCKIKFRRKDGMPAVDTLQDGHVDEAFFANHENAGVERNEPMVNVEQDAADAGGFADYDSDSDADMDDDIDESAAMLGDHISPGSRGEDVEYGDQLVAEPLKVKAVPLKYARVAKKVDVKRLKENIWRKLVDDSDEKEQTISPPATPAQAPLPPPTSSVAGTKQFTGLVKSMDGLYTEKKRKDISVAFCFICLLHLANEQGLNIEGDHEALNELWVSQPRR
ncbi:hypothetical protein HDV00_005657 [Rhizophlyctis rosea]|nr:hypothetical protein HDV00_005657 [Rhizophlyctis rosea]